MFEVDTRRESSMDRVTGLFDERRQEEFLCDTGAGHMLLHPSWLLPLAQAAPPSLDRLIEIRELCGGSIEATALQIARLGAWACTFVFWEPGLRKAQRIPPEQRVLTGLEDVARAPKEKLRARKIYAAKGSPYLPKNKSVDEDTLIYRSFAEQTQTEGDDDIDLGSRTLQGWCQAAYSPYYDESGMLRPRVVTCLVW